VGPDRSVELDGVKLNQYDCSPNDLIVGVESGLIRLHQYLSSIRHCFGVPFADVELNSLIEIGQLGRTHIVDCSTDDPQGYRFVLYGPTVRKDHGTSNSGRRVCEARTKSVVELERFRS
jgi:hypothetical protein